MIEQTTFSKGIKPIGLTHMSPSPSDPSPYLLIRPGLRILPRQISLDFDLNTHLDPDFESDVQYPTYTVTLSDD
eukprot:783515-Amorphochlora_amoeboformis.AAC.1